MNFLNLLFAVFFVGATFYDVALLYSIMVNRFQRRDLNSLNGWLGKIVHLETLVPNRQFKQELRIGWICDLLLILWNAFDFYQMGPVFFLGYSIVGILIGGIYFHHHFVKNQNHLASWYVNQERWVTNLNYDPVTKRFYRWITLDDLYSLMVINLPLAIIAITVM